MALRGWSWDAAMGPAGLADRPLLEALAVAIPDAAVEAGIEVTGTREQRRRRLPTRLVVTLVVAMGLWAAEAMRHVLAEVVAGWHEAGGGSPTSGGCRVRRPSSRPGAGPGRACCASCSRPSRARSPHPRRRARSWAIGA
jgi:hypothetical protein